MERASTDQNELWSYGPEAQKILVNVRPPAISLDALYLFAGVEDHERGLHADAAAGDGFPHRLARQNIGDQFMFGPALPGQSGDRTGGHDAPSLPAGGEVVRLLDGIAVDGGMVDAAAPLDRLPLFVRAGSIFPMGPDQQWSTQKPADPIEFASIVERMEISPSTKTRTTTTTTRRALRDHSFSLGRRETMLTIGDRKGQFPGMLESRTFRVVFVGENHGVGVDVTENADKLVTYSGKEIAVMP